MEHRFYFHSLLASSALADLQPERLFPHDLKMTAQCLAEITNYSQTRISKDTLKNVFERREMYYYCTINIPKNKVHILSSV
jgi:hypothetical protein